MTSLEASARFAAHIWYTECRCARGSECQTEANQFVKDHWQAFFPVAHEGWGRLLLRIADGRSSRCPRPEKKKRIEKRLLVSIR